MEDRNLIIQKFHCPLEIKMKRDLAFAILGIALALITSEALAGDEEIWGTYRLIKATNRLLDTGDVVNSYGEHPKGYITYGEEGRMLVLITYDGRPKPQDVLKTSKVASEPEALRACVGQSGAFPF